MPNTVLICGANETHRGKIADWVASAYPRHALNIRTMSSVTEAVADIAAGQHPPEFTVLVIERPEELDRVLIHELNVLNLMGTGSVVLALTGLQSDDRQTFVQLESEFADAASRIGITEAITIGFGSGHESGGDEGEVLYDWSSGISFTDLLALLPTRNSRDLSPLRFSVQDAVETDKGTRVSGSLLGGTVTAGEEVTVSPADRKTQALAFETGSVEDSLAGTDTVSTLTLSPGTVVQPGDLIGSVLDAPEHTDQFAAHVLWLNETELLPERQYTIRANAFETTAQVTDLKHRLNPETLEHVAAKTLNSGEIGLCNFSLDRDLAFDAFDKNPATGCFLLLDKESGEVAGFGAIRFGLRRATNLSWQETKLDKEARALLKGQKPCVLWFTGLSGAGKSAAADRIEQKLKSFGHHTYLLDGDNVRHGLNRDLGFTDQDRVENIRRVAEVSRLMADAGLIVLVSFISPFRSERRMARDLMDDGEFIEVFMDTPLSVCESRDPKGLYQKARAGQIKNFTGIDSDYETPEQAELTLQSHHHDVDTLADQVITYLQQSGKI